MSNRPPPRRILGRLTRKVIQGPLAPIDKNAQNRPSPEAKPNVSPEKARKFFERVKKEEELRETELSLQKRANSSSRGKKVRGDSTPINQSQPAAHETLKKYSQQIANARYRYKQAKGEVAKTRLLSFIREMTLRRNEIRKSLGLK